MVLNVVNGKINDFSAIQKIFTYPNSKISDLDQLKGVWIIKVVL